ncbi:hypothetical protein Q4E93_02515 [Flavitalea sp. BT771]|uniref:hypothetical protein n=1 Tax=Flavitalea sp. BT771 TaxID=3063329 RepID=UPI0026E15DE7|nr:hypothetical protein [Flavitalea sp. BT771]MDO6429444.1 hypothetical protein [Flavitalea sp. BT771]MDV6218428.1 hypothetical protein [Flavitalea sp. BT771]
MRSAGGLTADRGAPSGSTLQLIIRAKATATSEFYYFDNVKVAGVVQSTVNAVAGTPPPALRPL